MSVGHLLEREVPVDDRVRNSHAAFDGTFVAHALENGLRMSWATGASACVLDVDLRSMRSRVELTDVGGSHDSIDL